MVVEITAKDDTKKGSKSAKKNLLSLEGSLASVGTAIGGLGLAALVQQQVSVISEFQRLDAALKVVTGSTTAANAAMAQLKNFAATTPFQLKEVVDSFIKLKAMGLEPSIEALESYGNTAGAMGKTLNQMIEAVADAATGEFERLKEFGIKAKSQGDEVSFTFQGVTTTIGKNAAEIEGYLQSIGQIQFAGGMEAQMQTLGGKISNLQDSWDNLIVTFGAAGGGQTFIKTVEGMIWAVESFQSVVETTPLIFVSLFAGIEKGWENTSFIFDKTGLKIQRGFFTIVDAMLEKFGEFLGTISDGLNLLPFLEEQSKGLQAFADSLGDPMDESIQTLSDRLLALQEQHQLRLDVINETALGSFRELDAASQTLGGFGGEEVPEDIDGGGEAEEDPGLEKMRNQLQSQLDILLESQLLEREFLELDFLEKQILLESALEQKLLTQHEHDAAMSTLKTDYEEGITAIELKESKKRIKQAEKERKARIKTAQNLANAFSMISQIVSTQAGEQSRRDFEIQKAANTGQAIMNTYTGATKALASGGVWGVVQAALVIAFGLAQVSQIQSTSFDGGGSTGGTSAISIPEQPTDTDQVELTQPEIPDTEAGAQYTIQVFGNIVDHDQFARELITPLERAREDGEEAEL